MTTIAFSQYTELQQLSARVYDTPIPYDKNNSHGSKVDPNDVEIFLDKQDLKVKYKLIENCTDASGYYGAIYQRYDEKTKSYGEYVLVNRGTEITSPNDLKSDYQMAAQKIPDQLLAASNFMQKFLKENPNVEIGVITGHSLGGSLANLLSLMTDIPAVGINSYGVVAILENLPQEQTRINEVIMQQQAKLSTLFPNTSVDKNLLDSLQKEYVNPNLSVAERFELINKITTLGQYLKYQDTLTFNNNLLDSYYDYQANSQNMNIINIVANNDYLVAQQREQLGTTVVLEHKSGNLNLKLSLAWFALSDGTASLPIGFTLFKNHSIDNMQLNNFVSAVGNIFKGGVPTGIMLDFAPQKYDPLILDLDNDGIETVGLDAGVLFDHDGDGIKTATGWVAKDDGLLVLDRNNDGEITAGSELFGDNTLLNNGQKARNGYEALADIDTNRDGKISSADALYGKLQVWQDANQDGAVELNELKSLAQLGISSIKTQAGTNNVQDQHNGNVITASSVYQRVDGSSAASGAINFSANSFVREFKNKIDTSLVSDLPQMHASGVVRDLREAIASSPLLAKTMTQYIGNLQRNQADLETIVELWAATAKMDTLSSTLKPGSHPAGGRGTNLNASEIRKLNVLEKFTGMYAAIPNFRDPFANMANGRYSGSYYGISLDADKINKAYALLTQTVTGVIALQTYAKDLLPFIDCSFSEQGATLDFTRLIARVNEHDTVAGVGGLVDIFNYFKNQTDNVFSLEAQQAVIGNVSKLFLDSNNGIFNKINTANAELELNKVINIYQTLAPQLGIDFTVAQQQVVVNNLKSALEHYQIADNVSLATYIHSLSDVSLQSELYEVIARNSKNIPDARLYICIGISMLKLPLYKTM